MREFLSETPAEIRTIDFGFGEYGYWGTDTNRSVSWYPAGCAVDGWGGDDWFPVLNGSELRLGCKLQHAWSSTDFLRSTGNAKCLLGTQINTSHGRIRSYVTDGTAAAGVFSNDGHFYNRWGWRATDPCGATGGFNQNGVIPPNWPADGENDQWADLSGCKGLTIKSLTDLTVEAVGPGDEIELFLAPVDTLRPPATVDVAIRVSEARGRDEPIRWASLARWPSHPTFTFVVGDEPYVEPTQWVFHIECTDGTSKFIYYDPTGLGQNPNWGEYVGPAGFDLQGCLDDASELGLNPDTWVPGLVDRLQCLAEWVVTPRYPMRWHIQRLSTAMDDSALGDVRTVATAPSRVMSSMASSASQPSTITTGFGTVTLPAVDPATGNKIRLGLSVLVGLWAIRLSVRWLTAASNTKVGADESR